MKDKPIMHDYVVFYMAMYLGGTYSRTDNRIAGAGRLNYTDGYADIKRDNEVWEVKPKTPYGKSTGIIQMKRYTKNTGNVRGATIAPTKLPYLGGYINVTSGTQEEQGLLFYEYHQTLELDWVRMGETVGIFALVGAGKWAITMLTGIPAVVLP